MKAAVLRMLPYLSALSIRFDTQQSGLACTAVLSMYSPDACRMMRAWQQPSHASACAY
jgi:hypothetical protein